MKKIKSFNIEKELLNKFDAVIEKMNIKRSVALETLMEKFNNEKSVDNERLRRFIMLSFNSCENEVIKFSVNIEEETANKFFENTQKVKKVDAINKLIFEYLQLNEKEQFDIFFGG